MQRTAVQEVLRKNMAYNGGEYRYGRDDAEEVDDVEEDEDIRSSNDHCIVLIDARTSMSEPMDDSGTGMVSDSLQSWLLRPCTVLQMTTNVDRYRDL